VGRRKTHIAFEASGHSLWIHDLVVKRYGKERLHVAHPRRIRAIANTQEKNDANDAFWLAYLTHEGRLPEAYVPEGKIRELRIATRERMRTVQRRTQVLVRIRAHLAQMGERLPGTTLHTQRTRAALEELIASTAGSRGMALAAHTRELDYQQEVIASWEKRIEELVAELPAVQAIVHHIPGAGPVLAATVVAEAGRIQRLRSAKSFAHFTGLTPSDHSSARTRHGHICREGSPFLRWALTQMAMACSRARRGAPLAVGDWIRHRQKRMTIKAKARCAAGRKLGETIWRLFNLGECFDAKRAFPS